MVSIPITIRRKKAANPVNRIVCGNKDYQVVFDFDAEWNEYPVKTARFIYAGQFTDVVFEGNTCQVPLLQGVDMVAVGVFAGDLITSTPALIGCDRSILCGEGAPVEPSPDVYAQIMELLNSGGVPGGPSAPGKDGVGIADIILRNVAGVEVLYITLTDGTEKGFQLPVPENGKDYVLTDADRQAIAALAAQLVKVPDSYTKAEIDAIMGSYITDINTLVGGDA